jgi:hypothetical protein
MGSPAFPFDEDSFLGTVVELLKQQGRAREVGLLLAAQVRFDYLGDEEDFGESFSTWAMRILVDPQVYATLGDDRERRKIEDAVDEHARELLRTAPGSMHQLRRVDVMTRVAAMPGWREEAERFVRGEGITNQGRVRTDNIAARKHDGLLFRSPPEVELYEALKARGVPFAPLPVVLRGGRSYQRIEPDFVVFKDGVTLVVEVDGDTVHRETPAEGQARLLMLETEGVHVRRIKASECDTPEKAKRAADDVLQFIDRKKR